MTMQPETDGASVFLLTAVRNEARVIPLFFAELRETFAKAGMLRRATLVVVDDASTDDTVDVIEQCAGSMPDLRVEVLRLSSNRGNQSAMAFGLREVSGRLKDAHLLTFDADGEDDITRLPELVAMLDGVPDQIVFVLRDGRKESLQIRCFYFVYRIVYRLLAGRRVIPCNLMAIPGNITPAIVGSPLLSLHFSYPLLRLGLPYQTLPMARRCRYAGRSSQNIGLLIHHGLIGLTIFYEQMVARIILLSATVVATTAALATLLLLVRFFGPLRLPTGFTTVVLLSLFGFGFVSLILLVVFCLACSIFRLIIESDRIS